MEEKYQELVDRSNPTLEKLETAFKHIVEADRILRWYGSTVELVDGKINCYTYTPLKEVRDMLMRYGLRSPRNY
jgi:hypothetical protein